MENDILENPVQTDIEDFTTPTPQHGTTEVDLHTPNQESSQVNYRKELYFLLIPTLKD